MGYVESTPVRSRFCFYELIFHFLGKVGVRVQGCGGEGRETVDVEIRCLHYISHSNSYHELNPISYIVNRPGTRYHSD